MRSPEEVHSLYLERKKSQEPWMKRMREIAELANGDVRVVHPEIDANEQATVVNLFTPGLDALATRSASVPPGQKWPAVRPGIQASEDKARDRRLAGLAWWEQNDIDLMDGQRFRHFFGWGAMPVTILPTGSNENDNREIPHWRARSPLTAYPSPSENRIDMEPADVIFASRRTRSWLASRYGAQMAMLNTGNLDRARPDDLFDVLEYIDSECIMLCCAGRSVRAGDGSGLWTPAGFIEARSCVLLESEPNKAGMPLCVFPGRITLDRLQGALDQMLPAYHKAAKLDSLNILAIAQGIYPDTYLVGHPGDPQSPEVITDANGMMGIVGEVAHGTLITLANPPSAAQAAEMAIDRLERQQRLVGNLPAQIGGEGATNVRTARQGNDLLGSAIDMPIQEAQKIMARSKEKELVRAAAVQKAWHGDFSISFYVPMAGFDPEKDHGDYDPKTTFESDVVHVEYAIPGTDANSAVVAILQRSQGGIISQQTAREMDSAVKDPILERDTIELEGLRRAIIAQLEQPGQMTPQELTLIAKLKATTHGEIEDVMIEAQKQMQAQQAAQQQMAPTAPAAHPGLGAGGPAAGGMPGGAPSSPGLAQMLQTLSAPAKQGQAEAQAAQPPAQPVLANA